jgi:hypothetical protein
VDACGSTSGTRDQQAAPVANGGEDRLSIELLAKVPTVDDDVELTRDLSRRLVYGRQDRLPDELRRILKGTAPIRSNPDEPPE